jgi:hypothetical protein
MPTRSQRPLALVLAVGVVFAVSGCNALAKLKKKKPAEGAPAPGGTWSPSAPGEVDAANKADVTRFPDEVRLSNETAFVRVITFARTAPDGGGILVAVLDPDTLVLKHGTRFGSTLISFNRAAFPGRRFLGWVPDAAFEFPAAATPTATATAAPTAAPGACTMTLRTIGWRPSNPSCTFNETVRAGSPATLSFPCAGGSATARFGSQTFAGSADRSRVALSTSATGTFSGCQIRTTQTITGAPPNLSYFLTESIVGGSCKGVSTCNARATVTAQ